MRKLVEACARKCGVKRLTVAKAVVASALVGGAIGVACGLALAARLGAPRSQQVIR